MFIQGYLKGYSCSFIWCSCKSPDVFVWVLTMCQTYSIHILPHNTTLVVNEGKRFTILIANDLATRMTVLDILHTKTVANTYIAIVTSHSRLGDGMILNHWDRCGCCSSCLYWPPSSTPLSDCHRSDSWNSTLRQQRQTHSYRSSNSQMEHFDTSQQDAAGCS